MTTRMDANEPAVATPTPGAVTPSASTSAEEPPLGDLFKQLADESGMLVRQEIALAKAELRESARRAVAEAMWVPVWGATALVGGLVLVAFLVIGLGALINNYWLSALIVGVVLAGGGALMALTALKGLKSFSLVPEDTVATLKQDRAWVRSELGGLKRNITD